MKCCRNCWITRELTEFKKNWKTKLWTITYKPICKPCMNLMIRNSLKDTIVMVRWKPVVIPNEKRLKKNAYNREFKARNNEKIKAKQIEYYYSLSPEVRRARQVRQTKLAKLRRQKARLDLINKKRQCTHS